MKALPLPAVLVVTLIPLPLASQDVASDAPGRPVCQEPLAELDSRSTIGPHPSDRTLQDLPAGRDCPSARIRLPQAKTTFRGPAEWCASTPRTVRWARAPPARHPGTRGFNHSIGKVLSTGFPMGGL